MSVEHLKSNKFTMRRITICIAAMVFGFAAMAQDVRLLQTRVADILNQVPAQDLKQRDKVMEQMLALGHEGLMLFADQVVAPGSGDDTRVRFALNGLALYVGQEGMESKRLLVSGVFTEALVKAADPGVRSFFLYHLKFFGKEEIVQFVEGFLKDDELCDYAVQALVGIGSHAGQHALKSALAEASGRNRLLIVKGLGEYGAFCAEEQIRALVGSSEPEMNQVALRALANIGSAASAEVMLAAARSVRFGYDKDETMRSLIHYIDRLAVKGEADRARRMCNMLVGECTRDDNYTYSLAALRLLTHHFGYETLDLLMAAMEHPRFEYRAAALDYAREIDDIAALRKWMVRTEKLEPHVAAQVIEFLGQMGNPVVLPFVRSYLKSGDQQLKVAAVGALKTLQGVDALPVVIDFLLSAPAGQVPAARDLILPLVSSREIPMVAEAIEKAPATALPVLIELLSSHHAACQFDLVLKLTSHPDALVSAAAYGALANLSTADRLGDLLQLLDKTNDETKVATVQQALVVAAQGIRNPEERSGLFIQAYNENKNLRTKILGVLPRIGGTSSLDLVASVFGGKNRELRDLAFKSLTQWKDHSAATQLFSVVVNGPESYKKEAFAAYVRQIGRAPISGEQKLLALRKIMVYAGDPAAKELVLKTLESNKSFPALVYVASFLDDPTVSATAAWSVFNIAMPASGAKNGLYGATVRPILEKCMKVISGPESNYAKENIRNWLSVMPKEEGFVSMFNGRDLSGWQGLVENPIARAKMSKEELAAKQAAANAKLPENWTVANGEIRFTGTGYENLCSTKDYADFEMWVDWRISKNGDSGIYLRGTPQVQIWDPARVDVGAQVGSGGLYNNQVHAAKPVKLADNPVGEWNTFYLKMIGEHVTVYLNGELVVDHVVLENYWDRSIPIFPAGAIELQAHGTDLAFRDIYVREIRSEHFNLSTEEQSEGFTALFNGKDLEGWVGNRTDYKVEDGVIVVVPDGGGYGNLYTQKEYGDFAFRFEFKLTPGANNGIGIRTPLEGDPAYAGMEIQVLDDTSPIYANLQDYQYHGSVYGVIPARRGYLKPVGEWNEEEILLQGNRIRVTLNGTVIVDGDLHEASKNGTIDHNDHPGLKRKAGHIGFLGHGSVVSFRNIRIKEL